MIRTTVIIPNYNGIDYIEACLDSLDKAFKVGDGFEVVVVDNGSEDGSDEIVKKRESNGHIRLISLDRNTGFSYAVNRGIEASRTEYVLLLNNDITVEEDFVFELEKAISQDESIFSVNSVMRQMADPSYLDGLGDYYCALGWAYAAYKGKKTEYVRKLPKGKKIFSACGGASIYRKNVFEEIGMFDEEHFAYLEDVDIGYRARLRGYKNILCTTAFCNHAGSASSGSRYNEFKIGLASKNSIYIVYKNMPLLQLVINLPFLIIGFTVKALFFAVKGYGGTYIKGIKQGFGVCFSSKGRRHKFGFRTKYLPQYISVQVELWANIIRRLCMGYL